MLSYIVRRLLTFIPVWFLVGTIAFLIIHIAPGDPAILILGQENYTEEAAQQVRERLGLDKPLLVQLVNWFRDIFRGDLGMSYSYGGSVAKALLSHIPVTLSIALCAIIIAVLIGVPLGVTASLYPNTIIDTLVMWVALLGLSSPEFLTGLLLIFFFAVGWGIVPVGGYVPFTQNFFLALKHALMPSFALGFLQAALIARMTRSNMLEVLTADYVKTARAKGLREYLVIWKHAFRNGMLPVATVIGIAFALLLSGAFITELVFQIPGMGKLMVSAVKRRDYPIVQGGVLVIATIVLMVNLIVDIIYAYLDPRVTYD